MIPRDQHGNCLVRVVLLYMMRLRGGHLNDRVINTVWNWREAKNNSSAGSDHGVLRRRALLQAVIMGFIGGLLYFGWGHHIAGIVIWSLAGIVLVLGLAAPKAYRPVHNFGQWLGRMVGAALLYLLLAPAYYLVFFPAALLLRMIGRDPMSLKKREMRFTCWIARKGEIPPETYERQFLLEDKEARKALRPVDKGGKA